MTRRCVSVVIPTVGRPSLLRAVDSVKAQGDVEIEIIVVADLPKDAVGEISESLPDVHLLTTGGAQGGGAARSLGTVAARHPWIAYLDDDDYWLPNKLTLQLEAAAMVTERTVPIIASRVRSVGKGGRPVVVPKFTYQGGPLETYLFRRRRLAANRNLIHTSTLLVPAPTAKEVLWRIGLRRHQDWDFVYRCLQVPGRELIQLRDVLTVIEVDSVGSISSSSDWRPSFDWAQEYGHQWAPHAYADFLAGQPLRYALLSRDVAGLPEIIREMRTSGAPSGRALALAASGLLPRRTLSRIMHGLPFGPGSAKAGL